MKMITVFVPEKYLEALEELISDGHFPNRSEAIRSGIRDLIRKELIFDQNLTNKKLVDKKIEEIDE